MKNNFNELKAFSLVELIVVIGIFSIIAISVYLFSVDSLYFSKNRYLENRATLKVQETINAVLLNKDNLWREIVDNTNDGPKHITYSGNSYQIQDGSLVDNDIELSFEIGFVYRDVSGNIVEAGGDLDLDSRFVEIAASWQNSFGNTETVEFVTYITNWNTPVWEQTSEIDFNVGTVNDTLVTNTGGGAVELDLDDTIAADWCLPELTSSDSDLPGQGSAQDIRAISGRIYTGTGENASGLSFIDVAVTDAFPPAVTINSTYDGVKTNYVYGEGDYAYLTTDTNNSEVLILDLTTNPPTPVGSVDTPGSANGLAIYKYDDHGYVTNESGQLYVFDLSLNTGLRSIQASYTLSGNGQKLIADAEYVYVASTSDTKEIQVLNISNLSNIQEVAYVNLPGASDAKAIYVNSNSTRAFIARVNSATNDEVFIVNLTNKTGALPVLSSINVANTNFNDITVIEEDNIMLVTGIGGQEYQAYRIDNELSPELCGGIQVDSGIRAVEGVQYADSGNGYSYIVTGDSNAELKVVKGGPIGGGGGNGQGTQYLDSGSFESTIFDSGSSTTVYYNFAWEEVEFEQAMISVQVRAGDSPDLSGITWMGPDGSSNTVYTSGGPHTAPSQIQNKRYFQYKVFFTSDRINTPVFESFKINYQE